MIEPERIKVLNDNSILPGKFVLYWMQASQRTAYNHALALAIHKANKLNLPLLVFFGLTKYPSGNERSYTFMLQGLQDVENSIHEIGADFILKIESPETAVVQLAKNAALVVVDCDYQRIQQSWRVTVAKSIRCPLLQVETNVVVPIEITSPKEEYTAGTLRPKLHKHLDQFLTHFKLPKLNSSSSTQYIDGVDIHNIDTILDELSIDRSVLAVSWLRGGSKEAYSQLKSFVKQKLDGFADERNDPSLDYASNMSPYLHFGQISPIEIALRVMESSSPGEESYLEELIVRRELSMNFVKFNPNYDSIECLPSWAKTTLVEHLNDVREYIYNREEFEHYQTHDPYWNAAQKQLVTEGKMHGYMRMYWGKKIIEWTKKPENAYDIAIYLNDKYELDGRDPNGYAGIAWCFGKHDRAWAERSIFGKVRYMNDKGLKRKFDIESYARRYGF